MLYHGSMFNGDHQVEYSGIIDRIHRHNSIRDALILSAQSVALAQRKEEL